MSNYPVFIVGCDRSGTTLLRQILSQSPNLHIPEESKFIAALAKQKEIYGNFTKAYQRWFFIRDLQTNEATSKTFTFPIFNLTIEEAESTLANAAPINFFEAVAEIFTASARKVNKNRWGDKTPHQVRDITLLSQGFPNAKFIHMIRDGRDVTISIRKAGWHGRNFSKIARYWQEQVTAGISAGQLVGSDRYYEVRYEKLLLQPEKTLQKLCNWLNLEYTPSMLEYHQNVNTKISEAHIKLFTLNKKPLDSSRAYAWKKTLSNEEIVEFETIAGQTTQQLGYETKKEKMSKLSYIYFKFKNRFFTYTNNFKYLLKTKIST